MDWQRRWRKEVDEEEEVEEKVDWQRRRRKKSVEYASLHI